MSMFLFNLHLENIFFGLWHYKRNSVNQEMLLRGMASCFQINLIFINLNTIIFRFYNELSFKSILFY